MKDSLPSYSLFVKSIYMIRAPTFTDNVMAVWEWTHLFILMYCMTECNQFLKNCRWTDNEQCKKSETHSLL